MPFPLDLDGVALPDAGALGYAVAYDLARGGGQFVDGAGPQRWVADLARTGALDGAEVRALIRALLHSGSPPALVLAADLCDALEPTGVGPWLVAALVQHDLGVLLATVGGRTVEEALARAAASHGALVDPAWREAVLQSLRGVGAAELEARVLARWGSADELAAWGPGLLASGDPVVRAEIEAAREREPALVAALLGEAT